MLRPDTILEKAHLPAGRVTVVPKISEKERFLATLLGRETDRFPFFDLEPDEDALQRWRREGLAPGRSVAEVFALESHHSVAIDVRSAPRYVGSPERISDPALFARHYNPADPARRPPEMIARGRSQARAGRVLHVDAWGGGLLQMLGVGDWDSLSAAMFALVERPRLIEQLLDRISDFLCTTLEDVLAAMPIDYATFYEPIAANSGPVISPEMFARYALPGYRKVMALLEHFGVPLRVLCATGGDLSPLLPALIEAGINCLWISNTRAANMEYPALRRRFGPRLALIGGIDARALSRDEAAIRESVEGTVPSLLAGGRYLPCLDDRPRADMPLASYALYRRLLVKIARSG